MIIYFLLPIFILILCINTFYNEAIYTVDKVLHALFPMFIIFLLGLYIFQFIVNGKNIHLLLLIFRFFLYCLLFFGGGIVLHKIINIDVYIWSANIFPMIIILINKKSYNTGDKIRSIVFSPLISSTYNSILLIHYLDMYTPFMYRITYFLTNLLMILIPHLVINLIFYCIHENTKSIKTSLKDFSNFLILNFFS